MKKKFPIIVIVLLFTVSGFAQVRSRNVVLVTLDGARVEEVFGGLDAAVFALADKNYKSSDAFKRFDAATPKERREKLMPFFWKTLMANRGSIAGNRSLGSTVQTTNKMWFSYPGYSEILTGEAHDDVIHSNGFGQNPYPSVLDFLQKKLKLGKNEVADFSSWDAMNRIATNKPGSFVVNAGYEKYETNDPAAARLSELQFKTLSPWPSVRHDYYTFNLALAHMKKYSPRVMHIGLGETDDWAHDKNYERVLDALNLTDGYLKELFAFIDSDAAYRGKTTVIIAVDHGRGPLETWHDHGQDVPEAQYIWLAAIGPDMPQRGEWKDSPTIYQNQIAATLCKAIGVDHSENNPNAGKPIEMLFAK